VIKQGHSLRMVRVFLFDICLVPTYSLPEMEMKKLHMGTMSYGFDSMDEVAHQLAIAFGASEEYGTFSSQSILYPPLTYLSLGLAKHVSTPTGAQLATRGRRDMSSRVRDVVLSLALCHNARTLSFRPFFSHPYRETGNTRNKRRWNYHLPSFLA
jgi:hypothetical protein